MILIIYAEDKTYYYDKKEDSDIKETADKTDTLAVTVKIFICEAEDYISVINTSAEDTSVTSSLLSTLFSNSIFYFS